MCVKIYSKSRQIHENLTKIANAHGILTQTWKIYENPNKLMKNVQTPRF